MHPQEISKITNSSNTDVFGNERRIFQQELVLSKPEYMVNLLYHISQNDGSFSHFSFSKSMS